MDKIKKILEEVYHGQDIKGILEGIKELWGKYQVINELKNVELTEKDVVLITYGDQVNKKGEAKLSTLRKLVDNYLKGHISIVHILPFYPYTSDDGFSITDYYAVNSELGTWDEVRSLSNEYRLLFDAVINHNSSESTWFKGFLAGKEQYQNYYLEKDMSSGFEHVTRPRVSPLTHAFNQNGKTVNIWTTFSDDQVDLNYENPKVLLNILDLLLFYVAKGASIIRLDAVGFMWKEPNTACIHLPQTHALIKVMKQVVTKLNSSVLLLTETNVPHKDNISYFGNGDEADMVYNFTLPPLLAFSILNETTEKLTQWASNLEVPFKNVCYFNFLASHDGIGVTPVNNILCNNELGVLIDAAEANGGKVSYKSKEDGTQVPYEINCNYLSILQGPNKDETLGVQRSLLAHAILLTLPGLPAIYFHSLFGSINDVEGVEKSGHNRRINREKFEYDELVSKLGNGISRQAVILKEIKELLEIRKSEKAFNPYGDFKISSPENGVISIARISSNSKDSIYGYFNLKNSFTSIDLAQSGWKDIISQKTVGLKLEMEPLSFVWLKRA